MLYGLPEEILEGIMEGTTDGARLAEEKLKELKKKKDVEDWIAWYDSCMAYLESLISQQKCDLASEEAWVESYQSWIATAEADLANAQAALNSCRGQAGLPPL